MDKPALLDSQNSKQGRSSVVEWLASAVGFAGLVHRLDFGTSGLMVCAKNRQSAASLTADLQCGSIKRIYEAVVLGQNLPDEGNFNSQIDGSTALTRFRVIERFANSAHIEVTLETGRKHQIRRHFSESGHPLLGDHLYGKKGAALLFDRPALHASRLTVKTREFICALPDDLVALLSRLRRATRS